MQWNYASINENICFSKDFSLHFVALFKKNQQPVCFVAVFGICLGSIVNRGPQKQVRNYLQ